MTTKRAARSIGISLLGLSTLLAPAITTGLAQAHGFTENPPSRQAVCANGAAGDCGPIQWEPQSVEGPGNFPQQGPADGHLCSADNPTFGQLDDPRGGDWPATNLEPGQNVQFHWKNTASHPTESYRYFITKDDWDPNKPLTRDQLEPAPFATVDYGGKTPGDTEVHDVRLPAGKHGKHMIFAAWEIADTDNAFYSCSDVNLG